MSLPDREKQILINVEGELTGQLYSGRFTIYRILTPKEQFMGDLARRTILGPQPENSIQEIAENAFTLGQLSVRIVSAPTWWNPNDDEVGGLDIIDPNVISEIFAECMKAEIEWRKEIKTKSKKAETVVKKAAAKKNEDIPEDPAPQ